MRGTLAHLLPTADELRFIPACAGNAWTGLLHGQDVPVHPRMRGERSSRSGPGVASHGSSLHARGTPLDGQPRFALTRFIPACAGNAVSQGIETLSDAVHPRMRGERIENLPDINIRSGSSPHTRETHVASNSTRAGRRFSPAYAGNARRPADAIADHPVHPRMRGERPLARPCAINARGSSPHARGTQRLRESRADLFRFIPACAGNAAGCRLRRSSTAVHPRMRGERTSARHSWLPPCGSSPHARGTLLVTASAVVARRFIPACAGNAAGSRP